jgi:hypothetical protein
MRVYAIKFFFSIQEFEAERALYTSNSVQKSALARFLPKVRPTPFTMQSITVLDAYLIIVTDRHVWLTKLQSDSCGLSYYQLCAACPKHTAAGAQH